MGALKRQRVGWLPYCLHSYCCIIISEGGGKDEETKTNILVITCHDLGDYLGCYGTPVSTPHLDQLVSDGVKETHTSQEKEYLYPLAWAYLLLFQFSYPTVIV